MSSVDSEQKVRKRVFGEGRTVHDDGNVRRAGVSPEDVRNAARDAVAKILGFADFESVPPLGIDWLANNIDAAILFKPRIDGL
jgi:hypothetical protein